MNKYYRAQEEKRYNRILKTYLKEVLRIVDPSMINSANNVLANDDPPVNLSRP